MSRLQQVLRMESRVFQGEAARVPLPAAAGQVLDAGWSECPTQGGNLSSQEWASSLHQFLFSLLHEPLLVLCSAVTGFSNLWSVNWTLGGCLCAQEHGWQWGQLGRSCPNVTFTSSSYLKLCRLPCCVSCLIV